MEAKPSYKLSAPAESFRPTVIGRNYAISCGHYLAALAAARILDRGGNAVDAGVAAAMKSNVALGSIAKRKSERGSNLAPWARNRIIALPKAAAWEASR